MTSAVLKKKDELQESSLIGREKCNNVINCDYDYVQLYLSKEVEVKLPTICRDGKAEVERVRTEKSRSEKM